MHRERNIIEDSVSIIKQARSHPSTYEELYYWFPSIFPLVFFVPCRFILYDGTTSRTIVRTVIHLYHAVDIGNITEMADLTNQFLDDALLPTDGTYTETKKLVRLQ